MNGGGTNFVQNLKKGIGGCKSAFIGEGGRLWCVEFGLVTPN